MAETECHSPELTDVPQTSLWTVPTSTTTSVSMISFLEAAALSQSMLSRKCRWLFHHLTFVRQTSSVEESMPSPNQVPTHSREPLMYIIRMRTFVVMQYVESRLQAHAPKTAPPLMDSHSVARSSRTNSSSS